MRTSVDLLGNTALVVARALVPILGVVVLGWSAPKLLIVYFADTAAAYYAFLSALAMLPPAGSSMARPAQPDQHAIMMRAVFAPLPPLLLIGFFFGILPLFVMVDSQGVLWRDVLGDRTVWWGVLLQFAVVLGLIMRRALASVAVNASITRVQGACITMRWLLMVFVGFFLMPEIPRIVYGPLLIATYAISTAMLDLAPDKVLSWGMRIVGRPQVPRG